METRSQLQSLKRVLEAIDTVSDWVGRLSAFLIPAMMLIMTWEVVARHVLMQPTIWAMEISQYFFLATTVLGGGYLLLYGGHVNVTILYSRLNTRLRATIDVLTSIFFFFFVLALLQSTWIAMVESIVNREHSPTYWSPPIYPVYIIMTLGIGLMSTQGIAKVVRDLITAIAGSEKRSALVTDTKQSQDT